MLDFLQKDVDITNLSNFKTKSKAKFFFELKNDDDIEKLYDIYNYAKNNNISVFFLWWWTNILFAFDVYDWIIIKNSLKGWEYDNWILTAKSWENISNLAENIEKNYWNTFLHRFIWLPWSVWWAVYWNAWCFGLETSNIFISWKFFNLKTLNTIELDNINMNFWYRSSILKKDKNLILLCCKFDLTKLLEKYSSSVDNLYFREYKQPKWNSCWSFFKNPDWESAWKLIESVWLKWYRIWTAYISDLHSNFLMSDDNWSYCDILKLIDFVINKVKLNKWILLEPEVQILKNWYGKN